MDGKKTITSLRLPPELIRRMDSEAKKTAVTRSAIVRRACLEYLNRPPRTGDVGGSDGSGRELTS